MPHQGYSARYNIEPKLVALQQFPRQAFCNKVGGRTSVTSVSFQFVNILSNIQLLFLTNPTSTPPYFSLSGSRLIMIASAAGKVKIRVL